MGSLQHPKTLGCARARLLFCLCRFGCSLWGGPLQHQHDAGLHDAVPGSLQGNRVGRRLSWGSFRHPPPQWGAISAALCSDVRGPCSLEDTCLISDRSRFFIQCEMFIQSCLSPHPGSQRVCNKHLTPLTRRVLVTQKGTTRRPFGSRRPFGLHVSDAPRSVLDRGRLRRYTTPP